MLETQLTAYLAQALARSPRAVELCTALEGKRLTVTMDGWPEALRVSAAAGTLRVTRVAATTTADAVAADVAVRGSPLALLELVRGDATLAVAQGRVAIRGDERIAQQFQELARLLRPDLEAVLGRYVGRIPAHLATRAWHALADWGRAARDSLVRNVAEYLAHESRELVPRAEAESFLGGVEALRAQVAQLEARAEQLSAAIAQLAIGPGGAP